MGSLRYMFDEMPKCGNKCLPERATEEGVNLVDMSCSSQGAISCSSQGAINKTIEITSQEATDELHDIPSKRVPDSFSLPGKKKPPDKY